MNVSYEADVSVIPKAKRPTLRKSRAYEIVEELLESNKNVAVVSFDNKNELRIFNNSLRNLIDTHNPPISRCTRGLSIYIKKEVQDEGVK